MTAPFVFDAHGDSLQRVLVDGADLGRFPRGQADLPRWKRGGFGAQVFAVWVDTLYLPDHAVRRALQQFDAMYSLLERYPKKIALARTASQIRSVARSGRLAALISIEGGDAIQKDLGILRMYHRLGATSMTLTHSRTTDWCDSATDAPRWGGLNDFGREVVAEMNRLRMVVDVSHISDQAVRAALETGKQPVIASHSSCRALCSHPRNLPDELLLAIARSGGVIGINFYSEFLDQAYHEEMKARHKDLLVGLNTPPKLPPEELDRAAANRLRTFFGEKLPRPPFERILQHIDHAVHVAGVDHVGIGADLDSADIPLPEGFDDVGDYPKLARALSQRGYSDRDVRKIMGANFLRVFEEVIGE
ncbi:MAG: membrane dipeptidase [Gemmatimonadetes bacterium]|nr:membrane dipeptidase [Gemmatimonadota bacterium]